MVGSRQKFDKNTIRNRQKRDQKATGIRYGDSRKKIGRRQEDNRQEAKKDKCLTRLRKSRKRGNFFQTLQSCCFHLSA